MAYVPNPTDATQPTGNVDASTADDEFRALKGYILGLALSAGMFAQVRQCANDGVVDSSGNPAFIKAAVAGGAALDLVATARPLVVNFAGGNTGTGSNDRNSMLTGDTANVVAGLPVSNTSYIYADYVSAASWTWGSTLAPVQYGKIYPRTIGSILQFGGAAGAITFPDDFGNTWTQGGAAKIQTNQVKFGTGALGGTGALNVLNGASEYVKTTDITSLNPNGWAIRAWIYTPTLPGVGVDYVFAGVQNAGGFGANLSLNNTAGTIRFKYFLSSTGAANDIAAAVGTSLPVINTWYFVELTYDALAGIYRLYVGGLQENSTASALRVCGVTTASVGANGGSAANFTLGYIDKPEFLSYCQHPAGTAYAVPTAAPNIAAAGYAPDYFDFQAMKMYSVTGASAIAGTPPTLTSKYRTYLGEADLGVVVPSAVRNYAFNGKAIVDSAALAATTAYTLAHNLGVRPQKVTEALVNLIGENGYASTEEAQATPSYNDAGTIRLWGISADKNNARIITAAGPLVVASKAVVNFAAITMANWKMRLYLDRGW